ncbi:MAG TPA: hypothetical protein ENI27_00445 [bacterium]|nr:hypothetical protein [bacterium]
MISTINYSSVYNLAVDKIANYYQQQGYQVLKEQAVTLFTLKSQKVFLSAIFTYDLPALIQDANLLKQAGIEIEIGGPAATAMPEYVAEKTGVTPHSGLDERFEHINGEYQMTFTSRGCIRKCPWCTVQKVEPIRVEYDDFPIPRGKNPYLADNCILATSWEHQKLVVEKLKEVRNLDINSGFDCRLFTEEHYQLYSQLHLEAWRLAFDAMEVEKAFERAVKILKNHDIDYRRILVYCLIGFPGTTFEECVYRLEKTRALGCSPYPQKYSPLNTVDARNYIAPGFEKEKLDMLRTYWCNPFVWRTCAWSQFKKQYKPETDTPPMLWGDNGD